MNFTCLKINPIKFSQLGTERQRKVPSVFIFQQNYPVFSVKIASFYFTIHIAPEQIPKMLNPVNNHNN